jgi:hypothetical protein
VGEVRHTYKHLLVKLERKRPLGRNRHRWEDNKVDLKEIGWDDVGWFHVAQDRRL